MKKVLLWRESVRAATAIEYSLIASGIALAISVVVFTIGSDLTGLFQGVGSVAAGFVP